MKFETVTETQDLKIFRLAYAEIFLKTFEKYCNHTEPGIFRISYIFLPALVVSCRYRRQKLRWIAEVLL